MHDRFDWTDWADETPLPDYDARGELTKLVSYVLPAFIFIFSIVWIATPN